MLTLLRADAGIQSGTGHVMRCIALAQACKAAGGQCSFVSSQLPAALAARLSDEGFGHIALAALAGSNDDANECAAIAATLNASWIVIDGYHFPDDYYGAVTKGGHRIIAIDDMLRAACECADIVLRIDVNEEFSPRTIGHRRAKILSGPQYALLRKEFSKRATPRTYPKFARRLLVSLGGSDPANVTASILRALDTLPIDAGELFIVAGPLYAHSLSEAEPPVAQRWTMSVMRDVRDMATLMARSDVAIAAAGGTAWELAAMGVPSLLVSVAANQRGVAEFLHRRRAAIAIGHADQLTDEAIAQAVVSIMSDRALRVELSKNAQSIVDGQGAQRVAAAMLELESRGAEIDVSIRKADFNDSRLIWEWANDPAARAVSFRSEPIPWENHLSWIAAKLNDPLCRLYIGLNANREAIGQVRFDIGDESAIISVAIAARFRGQGFGDALIRQASGELFRSTRVSKIEALVKPGNAASISVFRKAGFVATGERLVDGQNAICFALDRNALS